MIDYSFFYPSSGSGSSDSSVKLRDSGTAVGVRVGSSVLDDTALDIARQFLAGYTGEYYFFQSDTYFYVLITGDLEYYPDSGSVVCSESTVYTIQADIFNESDDENLYTRYIDISGTLVGTETSTFSASGDLYEDPVMTCYYTNTSYFEDTFTVVNTAISGYGRYVTYGSFEGLPHLIEGADMYGFAQTFIMLVFFVYLLVQRVFSFCRSRS